MGRGEESESYRTQMLRRLKEKNRRGPPAEVLEAKKVIASFREQETRDREIQARLSLPLPNPHSCPQCFYLHGREALLYAVPHPEPRKFDRWKCNHCSYVDDVPTGIRS